jgi:hypothetical protein
MRWPDCWSRCYSGGTTKDCCCLAEHASCAATCECWIIPFDLFLVNHEIYSEAVGAVYSSIYFDFRDDPRDVVKFLAGAPKMFYATCRSQNWDEQDSI